MGQRLKFKCWKCKEVYSLYREIKGQPKLVVACPFCGAEATVELAPYRSPKVAVHKSRDNEESGIEIQNLPEILPTQPKD